MKVLVCLWLLIAPGVLLAQTPVAAVFDFLSQSIPMGIIGQDDRLDWKDEKSVQLRQLGLSTAIMVEKSSGFFSPRHQGYAVTAKVRSYRESDGVCSDERFAEQPVVGYCSAFLIAKDVVATANHCITDLCKDTLFIFDFYVSSEGINLDHYTADQVYACSGIIANDKAADWALLRLDHATKERAPFAFAQTTDAPPMGTAVTMLGYPHGLPLKINGGAHTVPNVHTEPSVIIEADYDSLGGSSGSPVIDTHTGELVGIHIVGFGDFEDDEVDPITHQSCRRPRRVKQDEDITPAWITRASGFKAHVDQILER